MTSAQQDKAMPMVKVMYSDHPNFMVRAERIIKIYNETHGWVEKLNLKTPEKVRIIYCKSYGGGLLIDSNPYRPELRIMFAGFNEADRGKGFLKACLDYAQDKEWDLAMVDVNLGDDDSAWKKAGYVHCGLLEMMAVVLSKRRLDFVDYKAVENMPPQDDIETMAKKVGFKK